MLRDIRQSWRGLRRNPAYTAIAVLTLTLGIGVNAAVFAVVDALAFRSLPVAEPDRMVALYGDRRDARLLGFSYPDWEDYRTGMSSVLDDLAGFAEGPANLSDGRDAAFVWTQLVTGNYFEVLRPDARAGRLLSDSDEDAIVLTHGFWQRRFGGDRAVIGRTVMLNGRPFTIVGVTGPRFTGTRLFSYAPDVFVPIRAHSSILPGSDGWLTERAGGWIRPIGRLRRDASLAQAEAAANTVAGELGAVFAATHGGRSVTVFANDKPINPWVFDAAQLRASGIAALLGVSLVLLIACANVANLQLARSTSRRREIAIRFSLGADRARVIRHTITESLLLSAAGGTVGVLLATWLLDFTSSLVPPLDFTTAFAPAVDWRVIAFTFFTATVAGLIAGAIPALRASGADPAHVMRGDPDTAGRRPRLLDALVVCQVAFSLVVVVAAGLFVQSLQHTRRIDPGFDLSRGLVLRIDPRLQDYDAGRERDFYERALERIRALPGVQAATRASALPLDGTGETVRLSRDGETAPDETMSALLYAVEPGYFPTLGVQLIDGRMLDESDDAAAPPVAVINQTLAGRLWPDGQVLERTVVIGGAPARIVGIVADTRYQLLHESPWSMVAVPLRQSTLPGGVFLVRTEADPGAVAPAVRRVISELDPALAIIGLRTLEENARYTLSAAQGGATGATLFGVLAVLLTAAGLYGVVSYGAARRAREIGIRMALGARSVRVVRMILNDGLRLALLGLAIGTIAALALSRLVSGLLYGVTGTDPRAFMIASLVLVGITALACALPAARATAVDPVRVLRGD